MVPLTSLMKSYPNIPDLGLGHLATAVRKAGFQVNVLGWNNDFTKDKFKEYIRKTRPGIIGIKVFTHNFKAAIQTVSIIKSTDPSIITVIGGPHPSASDPEETMKDFKEVDFAFRGDAEIGLVSLLNEVYNIKSTSQGHLPIPEVLKKIPGLIWRNHEKAHSNSPFFPKDLDSLGFPSWDMIDPKDHNFYRIDEEDKEGYVAPIMVTRGCPLPCTYCSVASVNGEQIRRRSVGSIIEEIVLLYEKYNVRQITIMDTSFLSDKDKVKELCNLIIEKRINVKWDCICDTLISDFYDNDILSLMFKAGCRKIIMGIESGSNKTLKNIKKKWDKEQFREVVSLIKSNSIKVHGYFMYGFPDETMEDMKDTQDFAFDVDFDKRFFNICFPLPGTALYEFHKKKYQVKRLNWRDFAVETSTYPTSDVSSKDVMKFLYQTEWRDLLHSFKLSRDIYKLNFLLSLSKVITKIALLNIFGFSKKVKQC